MTDITREEVRKMFNETETKFIEIEDGFLVRSRRAGFRWYFWDLKNKKIREFREVYFAVDSNDYPLYYDEKDIASALTRW